MTKGMDNLAEIANLSTSLTKRPEYNTKDYFDKLYNQCKNKDPEIASKAIKSVALVLVNILPSYSVGKHSEKENLSKDVRQRRELEQIELDFTRRFVQFCEAAAFNRQNVKKIRSASAIALSNLYCNRPNFNTAEHLSKCIVRLANCSEVRLRSIACKSIHQVFQNDVKGEFTLQILNNLAVTPTNKISVEVLQTLQSIKLKSHFEPKPKQPKLEDKELEKELRQADLITDNSQHQRNQTMILQHLFGTVFRFLKETKSETHYLEAMAIIHKYVDFINIDLISPILTALKQKRFSLRSAITSATTAISVCKAANIVFDLKDFYSAVYSRCYEALDDRNSLLELLKLFNIICSEIDKYRTASFAKRLMIMTLHAQTSVSIAIVNQILKMFMQDPYMSAACDFESTGESDFNIERDEPDDCGGQNAKYFELSILSHSYNPQLSQMACKLAKLVDIDSVKEMEIESARENMDRVNEWDKNIESVIEYVDKYELDTIMQLKPEKQILPKTFKIYEFQ